jgi:hypothetical protein
MLRHGLLAGCYLLTTASASLAAQGRDPPRPYPVRDSLHMAEPLGGYQEREGFWLGAGVGYGSFGSNGQGLGGFTGNVEAGWTLSRRLALGAGTSLWTRGMGRLGITAGSVDLRIRWYPSELAGGLFLSGALGLGFIRLSDEQAIPSSSTAFGSSFRGGIGFDFKVARGVSLTPFGTGAKLNTYKDGDHMWGEVWQMGLGVTIH